MPANTGEVLARFERVLVPELNLGQLALLLRARFLEDVITLSKVQGRPFTRGEILDRIMLLLEPSLATGAPAAAGELAASELPGQGAGAVRPS